MPEPTEPLALVVAALVDEVHDRTLANDRVLRARSIVSSTLAARTIEDAGEASRLRDAMLRVGRILDGGV